MVAATLQYSEECGEYGGSHVAVFWRVWRVWWQPHCSILKSVEGMLAATLQCFEECGEYGGSHVAVFWRVWRVRRQPRCSVWVVWRLRRQPRCSVLKSVESTAAATLKQRVGSVECSVRTEWRIRRQPQWGRVVQSSALGEACARGLQAEAAACRRSMGGSKDQTPLPRVPAALQLQLYMMAWPVTGKLANEWSHCSTCNLTGVEKRESLKSHTAVLYTGRCLFFIATVF